ncbi:MAG: MJ0042-type zinc finger domain-containing protein, partial [Steroidobacterales bacterium]
MFTVCPKCALTLAVTATDLRVAQGYVRCGRCLNVFNALARLSEERPAAAPEPPAEAPTAGVAEQAASSEQGASPEQDASPE